MSLVTATKVAAAMSSTPVMTFDEMASSAIGELGNMISGNATTLLSEAGYECQITPPALVRGAGVEIATATPALVVPLYTDFGKMEINVALEESEAQSEESPAEEEREAAAVSAEPESAEEQEDNSASSA